MNLLAPVNRDIFSRPLNPYVRTQGDVGGQSGSVPLDPASLLDLFAHIHALGLAHLASGRDSAGQADGPTIDQRASASPVPLQTLHGGLLGLLAATPAVPPSLASAAAGTTDTTRPEATGGGEVEGHTQQRYVSRIQDGANGGPANQMPGLLARLTNCDEGFLQCLGSLKDMRSAGKCYRMKDLCESGVPAIFRSGIGGRLGR